MAPWSAVRKRRPSMAVTVALRASVAATDTRSIAAGGFTRVNRRPSVVVRTAPARPTSQHTVPAGDDPAVSTPASSGSVAAAKGAVAPAANSMDIPARRQRPVPSAATTIRSAARRLAATRAVSRKTRGAALADDSCRLAAGGAAAGGARRWRGAGHRGFGAGLRIEGRLFRGPPGWLRWQRDRQPWGAAGGAAATPIAVPGPTAAVEATRRRRWAPATAPLPGAVLADPGTSAPWECARIPPPRAAAGSFPRRALACSRALAPAPDAAPATPTRRSRALQPRRRARATGGATTTTRPPRPRLLPGAGLMRASVATSAWHSAHAARCASIDCAAPASRRRSIHAAAASASRWGSPAAAAAVVRNARFSSRSMTSSRRRCSSTAVISLQP